MKHERKHTAEKILLPTLFFALYMFEYMVTLTFIDKRSTIIMDSDKQLLLHYMDYIMVTIGMLIFAFGKRVMSLEKDGKMKLLICIFVYAMGISVLRFVKFPFWYSVSAGATALFLGIIGGMIYWYMAVKLIDSAYMGRIMGFGASAAVAFQYLLQEHIHINASIPILIVAVMGMVLIVCSTDEESTAWIIKYKNVEGKPDFKDECDISKECKYLLYTCIIVLIFEGMGYFLDTSMLQLSVRENYNTYNIYAWPRLFLIVGYLIAGFAGDYQHGKILSLIALCNSLMVILNLFLISSPELYCVNTIIFYIFLGVSIGAYYNIVFWRIAPKTKRPELWASMGRILTGPLGLLLSLAGLADLSHLTILVIDLLLIVAMIMVMILKNDFLLKSPATETNSLSLAEFEEKYGFTQREREVFEKTLVFKGNMKDMAKELAMSDVLYRHMKSIYEKTGKLH